MSTRVNTYSVTKSKLVHRGKTLRGWAIENNIPVGSVYNAVRGTRKGVRSVRIRNQLKEFLNDKSKSNGVVAGVA